MVIHFFRNRQDQQFDSSKFYVKLIDGYFDKLPHCTITSNDDVVNIEMKLDEFDFKYSFLITRRSRVSSLYRLSPDYMNINLLIDVPANIPDFLYRTVLQQVGDVCTEFGLKVYYDGADNISDFNMFSLITILKNERDKYYKNNPDKVCYSVDRLVLSEIFGYQSFTTSVKEYFTTPVKASYYVPLYDKFQEKVVNAVAWKAGTAAIFPPHLDFVIIEELEGSLVVIPMSVFEKNVKRFLSDVKDCPLPIRYLNEKYALKAMKLISKMRKSSVPYSGFERLSLTNLVEGE